MSSVNSQLATNPPLKKRWRFSLATLALSAALAMAILTNLKQFWNNEEEQQKIWRKYFHIERRQSASLHNQHSFDTFRADDKDAICVSMIPSGSQDDWLWQINTPSGDFTLRTATQNIPADGLPSTARGGGGYAIHYSTMFTAKLYYRGNDTLCGANPPPTNDAILMACQSVAHQTIPAIWKPYTPGINCVDLPDEMHVWSVAGDGKRESFSPDQPVVLLRMRDKPQPETADPTDVPGAGFMVWIERAAK